MLHIIHAALRQIPIFARLDLDAHADLISRINLMYYPARYAICRQGDAALEMYVIKTGEVEIIREESGSRRRVALLQPGGFFGEMALIDGTTRNAAAEAVTDVEVFVLDRDTLRDLLAEVPDADMAVVGEYLRRRDETATGE